METTYGTQFVADSFVNAIDATSVHPTLRKEAFTIIGKFEGCGWHPMILQDAIAESGNGQFYMTETEIVIVGKGAALTRAIIATLQSYCKMNMCC